MLSSKERLPLLKADKDQILRSCQGSQVFEPNVCLWTSIAKRSAFFAVERIKQSWQPCWRLRPDKFLVANPCWGLKMLVE